MNENNSFLGQPDTEISGGRALRAMIADLHINPLDTVEKIYYYNSRNGIKKIILSGAGAEGDFIVSCSRRLNNLVGTDGERALMLHDKLKSILDRSSGKVMLSVWCDVGRITLSKEVTKT